MLVLLSLTASSAASVSVLGFHQFGLRLVCGHLLHGIRYTTLDLFSSGTESLECTRTCLRVLVGWKEVLMPNSVRILLMTPEVFFTYIQEGHIGIWWGGALTRRSAVGQPLYIPTSCGNHSFSEHQQLFILSEQQQ